MRCSNSYQQLKGMPKSIPNPNLSVLRPRSPTQETLRKCKLHFQNWTHFFASFTSPSKNPRSHSSGIPGDFLHGSHPGVPNVRSQANTLVDYIILQCQKPRFGPSQTPSLNMASHKPFRSAIQKYMDLPSSLQTERSCPQISYIETCLVVLGSRAFGVLKSWGQCLKSEITAFIKRTP